MKNKIYLLQSLSEDLKDFIRKCLIPDEKKRFSIKDITQHAFINRIAEEQTPLMMRKITSVQDNQEQKVNNENNGVNRPKVLHHRQTRPTASPNQQF